MKTKVVKTCHFSHVNVTCNMSNGYVDHWDMRHVTELQILTFELIHENKSCSAFAKDQHKHVTDTVTNTNKDTQVPSFCHVDIF